MKQLNGPLWDFFQKFSVTNIIAIHYEREDAFPKVKSI